MSGSVRNVEIRDCVFIGTDTGLRFKSTRGRGGVVENIHMRRIFMKDIPASAITFNLYYSGQAPIVDPGQTRSTFSDEATPVSAETPQFKSIFISDVICRGAGEAIELLGLPEMPLRDIELSNVSISSQRGLNSAYTDGIKLHQVEILSQQGPVMAFHNGMNVAIDQATYPAAAEVFLALSGDKTENISIRKTNLSSAKQELKLAPEVNPNAVKRSD
jgi:hypothetical protein